MLFSTYQVPIKDENNIITHYELSYYNPSKPDDLPSATTFSPAVVDYVEKNGLASSVVEVTKGQWRLVGLSDELLGSYGEHINAPNSPITFNPFYYSGYISIWNTLYNTDPSEPLLVDFLYKDIQGNLTSNQILTFYNLLYVSKEAMQKDIPVLYPDGSPVLQGGFQARDEKGNFMYDEDGKPVQQLYTLEQVAVDNRIYGVESMSVLPKFRVGIQLVLTENGLEASIIGDSLRDSSAAAEDITYDHGLILNKITVLPRLTYTSSKDGMIVIPDGSGAVIDFKNWQNKIGYPDYGKQIYGRNLAFTLRSQPEDVQDIMFGMYGIMDFEKDKGIMAVVEKGAAQTQIFANSAKSIDGTNSAYFVAKVRQDESVRTGSGWYVNHFNKWTKELNRSDIVYNYIFLDETEMGYVELANKYREYLIDKYSIVEKDTTTKNLVDLNFLGAFERYDLLLGIRYKKDDSLTTFAQAQNIVEELKANNVDTISASYSSWTKDEMEPDFTNKFKVSPVLGGTKGMTALNKYLVDQGIAFYPEVNVTSAYGYNYNFGNLKYTARGVGNTPAKQYPFNLATLQVDRQRAATYYISPQYYRSLIEKMLPSYNKLDTDGVYLSDLGNSIIGNYKKDSLVYADEATLYQRDALNVFTSDNKNLKLSAPFDYAFQYVNLATNVPADSSFYGVFDYSIPFYQLVASGLFDYTMDYVNGTSDKSDDWYFIKSLETGANIQFLLSYEDPKILLDTDYTMYYKAYYENWKQTIIDLNNRINEVGIHQGRLVNHEILSSGLVRVTYEIPGKDNLVLLLNNTSLAINDGGNTIKSNDYLIVGGGA